MLNIGLPELIIVGLIAVLVVGPKDLPRAIRGVSKVVKQARGLAREFQSGIDDIVRESELEELRRDVNSIGNANIRREIEQAADPYGEWTPGLTIDQQKASKDSDGEATPDERDWPDGADDATDDQAEPRRAAS